MSDQTFSTKTEQAYWILRRAIVTGEFEDWAPLDEVELTSKFDVGRTPIREAIKQLASEEFVVWHPHRTPHVRSTSADDLAQLYEARQIFEVTAARLAAARATSADLEIMERQSEQLEAAAAKKKLYEVAELDYDFHLSVAKASHNRFLVDAISHLNFGSLRLWYRSYVRMGTERINDHHCEELEAIRNRDAELAVKVALDHIQFSHERQLRVFGLSGSGEQPDAVATPLPAKARGRKAATSRGVRSAS
jgi:DNA-binding GntR family transcriptional regulator